jgi:hypothetical protein
MFAKFLEGIEATVDHVINELAKDGAHLVGMSPTSFIAGLLSDSDRYRILRWRFSNGLPDSTSPSEISG